MLPRAACVLMRFEDRVLAISRGHDVEDLGLPGGRVEPGETVANGAVREMLEETGVGLEGVQPLFTARSDTHLTTTFEPVGPVHWPNVLASHPFEGYVRWARPSELCRLTCSHASYHRALFAHLGVN